jgi:hypothetical protein
MSKYNQPTNRYSGALTLTLTYPNPNTSKDINTDLSSVSHNRHSFRDLRGWPERQCGSYILTYMEVS